MNVTVSITITDTPPFTQTQESTITLNLGVRNLSFEAQVFSTTASFLRYNLLNYLNEKESYATLGRLFEHLSDEFIAVSYAKRLWKFFRGLFMISLSTIFELFKINDDFHEYFDALTSTVQNSQLFQGCET